MGRRDGQGRARLCLQLDTPSQGWGAWGPGGKWSRPGLPGETEAQRGAALWGHRAEVALADKALPPPRASLFLLSPPCADGLYQIQGIFPVWALVTLVASALALIIFITTSNEEPPKYHCVRCPPALSTHQEPAQPAPDWAEQELELSPSFQCPRRCAGSCGMHTGTSLLLFPSGVCLPWVFGQCHVDQRGGHGAGEHPAHPGHHLPAQQHRAGPHTAGLGQQHRG